MVRYLLGRGREMRNLLGAALLGLVACGSDGGSALDGLHVYGTCENAVCAPDAGSCYDFSKVEPPAGSTKMLCVDNPCEPCGGAGKCIFLETVPPKVSCE